MFLVCTLVCIPFVESRMPSCITLSVVFYKWWHSTIRIVSIQLERAERHFISDVELGVSLVMVSAREVACSTDLILVGKFLLANCVAFVSQKWWQDGLNNILQGHGIVQRSLYRIYFMLIVVLMILKNHYKTPLQGKAHNYRNSDSSFSLWHRRARFEFHLRTNTLDVWIH